MSVQVLELREMVNTLSEAIQVLKLQRIPPTDLIESSRTTLKKGKAALVIGRTEAFPAMSAELHKAKLACEEYLNNR